MVSIASGSSGNCIYIGSDNTHVLVDAGISNKRIEMGLNDLGLNARELDGILITHEHSDHIKGLGVLARKYGTPIYSTKETLEEIQDSKSLGEIPEDLMHPITPDVDFMVGDLEVKPFRIDHDAANPVAYRVQNEKRSVAVATDMGHYSQYIIDHLQGLDAILLEANHDVIEYRDRPSGSESKLNTYSDGFKVLKTIGRLYKNYRPFGFFGRISTVLMLVSMGLLIPEILHDIQVGKVKHPFIFVSSGILIFTSIVSFFSGAVLSTLVEKERQAYEFRLQMIEKMKSELE